MDQMTGIILTDTKEKQLGVLTEKRSTSAMPIAGRYRLIDFILSSMVNSGIRTIGIATQYNYSSLMDHLGSGKAWDLNRKNKGLYILPPHIGKENTGKPAGDIDVLYGITTFIRKTKPDYVVFSSGNTIYNTTFNEALEFHKSKHADITILYNTESNKTDKELKNYTHLSVSESGRVSDIMKNYTHSKSKCISMETYIIERSLLLRIIETCIAHGQHDWVVDVLIKNLGTLDIYAYEFNGYVGRIDTIESYYKNNMNFLMPDVRKELLSSKQKIYTKVKDQVPTRYGNDVRVPRLHIRQQRLSKEA